MLPKIISQNREQIRVLHVDDDPNQFEFIKFFLNQVDDMITVNCIGTPEEAFNELDTGKYDCLVTDFQMPIMNGIELSTKVREKHALPIILYTGQGSEEVAEAAFTIGVDDYLRKEMDPSHYQVLAKRIRHVVEKKRAEVLYQRVVEGIRDGLCIVVGNEIVYANQTQATIFGAECVEEIIGTDALSYVHPEDLEFAKERMDLRVKGKLDPPFYKYRIKRLDEDIMEVEALTSVIKYNGQPAFLVLTRDQTEQNLLKHEREVVEERFRTIIELAPDGIVTVSLKGVVTSVNPAFLNITGYSKDEILGKMFYKLGSLRGIDLRNNLKVFASIARGKLPPPVEFVFQYKDGTQGWGEAHLAFIDHDNSKELMAIIRDITERKWVEREINKYSDELKQVVIDRRSRKQEKTIDWNNHVTNSIGNELLGSIMALRNSILKLRKDPSNLEEMLDNMEFSVDSASLQLKELFEEGDGVHASRIDVFNLVEETVLKIDVPPEVSVNAEFFGEKEFRVQPDQIKNAIVNLVNNSLDSMPDGGELHVSCDSSNEFLVIEIKDNSLGLNDEQVELLRNDGIIDTNLCKYSILEGQKVAENHGGSILVNSEFGKGTSYTMILPKDYRTELTTPTPDFANQKTL